MSSSYSVRINVDELLAQREEELRLQEPEKAEKSALKNPTLHLTEAGDGEGEARAKEAKEVPGDGEESQDRVQVALHSTQPRASIHPLLFPSSTNLPHP